MTKLRDDDPTILSPESRFDFVGHDQQEQFLRDTLSRGALNNGWMITGPSGIGKATLAYRIARAVLSPASHIQMEEADNTGNSRDSRLISQKSHPDLFVAERAWDEKKQRYLADISVETIRRMIKSFARTSDSGKRIAIIDTADDLNRNAANALLKVLEEPPAGALIMLLVNSPGRILPTIRSRCRVLNLHPVADDEVEAFLTREADLSPSAIERLISVAEGRPGYALQLALSDGSKAMTLVDDFFSAIAHNKGTIQIAEKLTPKADDDTWRCFQTIVLQQISRSVRHKAEERQEPSHNVFATATVTQLLRVWDEFNTLIDRGTALNSDRGQIILTMGIRMRAILYGAG